jgi:hypothetical protein
MPAKSRAGSKRLAANRRSGSLPLRRAVASPREQWNAYYESLAAFRRDPGHCPASWNSSGNRRLLSWMQHQRCRKKQGKLGAARSRRLDRLGFAWDGTLACSEPRWMRRLEELAAFRQAHGHCCVSNLSPDSAPLGDWVRRQRVYRRRGKLSDEQIRLLDELGFAWEPWAERRAATWEIMYAALTAFRREHGHCRVTKRTENQAGLAVWASEQRADRRRGRLTAKDIRLLDKLNFPWDRESLSAQRAEASWEPMYRALAAFHRRFGHCRVPSRYETQPGLVPWIAQQRIAKRRGRLSAEHVRRLDKLAFRWGDEFLAGQASGVSWESAYTALAAFQRKHGHCRVTCGNENRPGLSQWASRQRFARRQGELSAAQVRRLSQLGFV